MFFDLASGGPRKLTDDTLSQVQPDISGDLVVWEVEEADDQDIVVHDLRPGAQRTLTGPDTDEQHPAIAGRHVVWEEWDSTGLSLVLVELER